MKRGRFLRTKFSWIGDVKGQVKGIKIKGARTRRLMRIEEAKEVLQ